MQSSEPIKEITLQSEMILTVCLGANFIVVFAILGLLVIPEFSLDARYSSVAVGLLLHLFNATAGRRIYPQDKMEHFLASLTAAELKRRGSYSWIYLAVTALGGLLLIPTIQAIQG